MQKLTDIGENLVAQISGRYGLSREAIIHMMVAINNGGGSMAQFSCSELGGSGQWMRGGMTMVGDMFNSGLKNTVDNLCNELSTMLSNNQIFPIVAAGTPESNQWWPTDLGSPFSSGAQNNTRYAIFPNRLAVELNGQISVYDTLDHNIGGTGQQQGNNATLTFTSQWGNVDLTSLPLVSGQGQQAPQHDMSDSNTNNTAQNTETNETAPVINQEPSMAEELSLQQNNTNSEINTVYSVTETLDIIEKLAKLRDLGALTDDEYNLKKSDLLKRI
ncbi:SHOCT domain-containing protein [Colwellia sp. E2M01]|uniref:SHOCT domain-containing protein n=1 Tax=Colwellia sp. E2M01 TaxID=2841561 RepID=UPI001C09640A|nr:SHOCT domain-containing protein [Colwellia sp. E2M01]MBU2871672.1 SHOCT domain-containing protein [Colwellia sp. E2M01]